MITIHLLEDMDRSMQHTVDCRAVGTIYRFVLGGNYRFGFK